MTSLDNVTAKSATTTLNSKPARTEAGSILRTPAEGEETTREEAKVKPTAVEPKALEQAVRQVNQAGASLSPALEFELSSESDVVVIKVINRSTGEVIRQLPPEAVVDAATRGDGALPQLLEADA
ncbi:MAG: flagellar protein FlaG [Pseudomonadota bacterium]